MVKAQNSKKINTLSLYIHIPFCKTICVYCGFLTFANKNDKIHLYIDALKREIARKSPKYKNRPIVSIYFGGGTPSLPEANQIEEILKSIREHFSPIKNPEITIECNPESITPEKLKHYRKYGINRLSLGIQSLDNKCLRQVARFHNQETALKAIKLIKKAGFTNYGLDFILGLPYQTLPIFRKELEQILKFNPPHLSYYFLSHDTKKIDLILPDCPSEAIQIAMYGHLVKTLQKKGYLHYEVSNYAKPGFECRHNLRYWHQEEYLGLGLGAHSYIGRQCTENEKDFAKYLLNPCYTADRFEIDDETDQLEYIMLHLRTGNGIDLTEYNKKYGTASELIKKAKIHIKKHSLIQKNNHLMASNQGFLLIDRITTDLL